MYPTKVIDGRGRWIGEIEDVVLDKMSNDIMYAVVSLGGPRGISEKYYLVPWAALNFDKLTDSCVVKFTKEQIEGAPAASLDELIHDEGQMYRDKASDYYKAAPNWDPPRH
jgi:sporulation protein YlmC with PRC-barrel domain